MRKEDFLDVLGDIDESFVMEAESMKKKKTVWLKWAAMAACLCLLALSAVVIVPGFHSDEPENTPVPEPVVGGYRIMHIENIVPLDRNLPVDTVVLWDEADVIAYFGKDLTPAYIPDGLKSDSKNGTASVMVDENGAPVCDAVCWNYYDEPESALRRGFTVAVSKIEKPYDFQYLWDEQDLLASYFGEIPVIVGSLPTPYGEYDPATHEVSGYYTTQDPASGELIGMYDKYCAEFVLGDIQYQIIAERMTFEDFIRLVKSVVLGDENAPDVPGERLPDKGTPLNKDNVGL